MEIPQQEEESNNLDIGEEGSEKPHQVVGDELFFMLEHA